MTAHPLTVSLAANGRAALVLPQPLTVESLRLLEQEITGALAALLQEISNDAASPGELEYASWMQYLRPRAHE